MTPQPFRNDPALRPGETLTELSDGILRLRCPNGYTHDFTREEWDEYSAEYIENRRPVDILDWIMGEIAGRDILPTSEVIDLLLDLRPALVQTDEALSRAVATMMDLLKDSEGAVDDEDL